MSGASFILAINLLIAGLFCTSFVVIAFYDSKYRSARWFAAAYATGMLYAVLEVSIPRFSNVGLAVFLGHTAFLLTLLLLNIGIARRFGVPVPRTLLTAAFAISMVGITMIQDMPRDSLLRMYLYQTPFSVMQAIGASIVFRAQNRRVIDNLLGGFLVASALHFLSKPLLASMVGGPGARPQDYLGTTYAMLSQSLGAVIVVATGLLLLLALMMDIMKDMTAKSETDLLSGLLNRRGFEERMESLVRRHPANGLPVSLVICDLDHFKDVNDTYGHGVGDRLITLFARTLRDSCASHHVLGRVGGEEFAVVLPGSNLAAARLLAESVRGNFSGIALEDVPEARFTASFGVAELTLNETPASFMARADAALYQAKRTGRDCVRVSRMEHIIEGGKSSATK